MNSCPVKVKVFLEKLTGLQLVKKLSAFYGTQRFITAFKSARYLSQAWASSIHSMSPSNFLKIHLNIILPSTPGSPKWSLSLRFPHQNPVYATPLHHTCYTHRPSHSSRFDHPNNIWWAVQIIKQYRSLSSSLCSFLHSPVTSSLLGPNILLNTLFSNTPQPTFLPQCERPSFTPIQNRQNYRSVNL